MLELSDHSITDAARFFADQGVEAAFLVPTETGMAKSIMDAHSQLREWLKRSHLHDYDSQPQGEANKTALATSFIGASGTVATKTSLYRPVTKSGDPRLWIYRLKTTGTRPGNLLALFKMGPGQIAVVNVSLLAAEIGIDHVTPELGAALTRARAHRAAPADDLLEKLRRISDMGFVPSLRVGDTGVGYTLETLLGIPANSSKAPDYRGIEIKATRARPRTAARQRNRVNLFSKTPDWTASPIKSGRELLTRYGYEGQAGRRQLYCSISNRPNPQGLFFQVSDESLTCWHRDEHGTEVALVWSLAGLQEALLHKHASTFWVGAESRVDEGMEAFHYREVVHSQEPLVANLPPLLASGIVTMDLTLSEKETGRARDHGYLFKIWPHEIEMLIPRTSRYDLTS